MLQTIQSLSLLASRLQRQSTQMLLQTLSSSQLHLNHFHLAHTHVSVCCIRCLLGWLYNWRDNRHIFIEVFSTTLCGVSSSVVEWQCC